MKGRCGEHAHQLFRGGFLLALLPRTREKVMAQTPLPLRFREAPGVPVIGAAFCFKPRRSSTRSAHRARNLMGMKAFVTFRGALVGVCTYYFGH